MNILLISVTFLLVAVFFMKRYFHRKKNRERLKLEPKESVDKSCLILTLPPCRTIIGKALECLSSQDDLAVCRNHRLGRGILKTIGCQIREYTVGNENPDIFPSVYHGYMLEATEKIAETSRHIITCPGYYFPLSYKCEIDIIRVSLDRLLKSTGNIISSDGNTDGLRDEIARDKDFIEHTISEHSKAMTDDDFYEDSTAYSYLMLLYYLNSFLSSFSHVIRNIEINENKFMTA